MINKRQIGKLGEDIASDYLERNGIRIICKNYLSKYGEIDLIGFENQTIIFIEVKLRNSDSYGLPFESVNYKKIKRLNKVINYYLANCKLDYDLVRFDVISITVTDLNLYDIKWLKNQDFS